MQRHMMVLVAGLLLAACAGRNAPATQPAPATYDPSKNDPKAVEIATAMVTALGGAEAWDAVKQVQFDVRVVFDDKDLRAMYAHAWDRWNARHRLETTNMESYRKAQELNDPKQLESQVVMYRLFERDRGAAYYDGNELASEDKKKAIAQAYERWRIDTFMLTLPFKVKDPGVYLGYEGETQDEHCPNTCDVIKITFDPSIGKDVYRLNIDRTSKLPVLVEIDLADGKGRMAYRFEDWTDVGGLKFSQKRDNIGARASGSAETWFFENIRLGSPDDMLYIPQVR